MVLSNCGMVTPEDISDGILSILLPAHAKSRTEEAAKSNIPRTPTAVPSSDSFTGAWTGFIRTQRGDSPLSLTVHGAGDIHAKLGSQLETLINQARFRDGRLSGSMLGDVGVAGAPALKLYLYMRDGVLRGAAVTDPSPQLPHWVELKKSAAQTVH